MMLSTHTPAPKQVLLRLPDDVASKLARAVPPRKRNQFLVDLLRRELEKEDQALAAACDALNALDLSDASLRTEASEWLAADLTGPMDAWDTDFDAATFSREAVAARTSTAAPTTASKSKRRRT